MNSNRNKALLSCIGVCTRGRNRWKSTTTAQTRYHARCFDQHQRVSSRSGSHGFVNATTRMIHCFKPADDSSGTKRSKATMCKSTLQQQTEHHIPKPTWSVDDLELASTHISVSQLELERLARLVLVDVSNDINNSNTVGTIRQDLGNMLHMIQHVTELECRESIEDDAAATKDRFHFHKDHTSATIYDIVRGVKNVHLRNTKEEDRLHLQDSIQARAVWERFLQPALVRRGGGHEYFSIETAEIQ